MQPYTERSNIRDANNRRVQISGTVNLTVRIGNRTENVRFNVVERLGTDVIIGCDYLDKHVEAIRPRKRAIEMDDGTTVPIIRGATSHKSILKAIPEEDQKLAKSTRTSRCIHVVRATTIKPNTQAWVEVQTQTSGLILVELKKRLYETHTCLVGNGIAQVEPNKPFRILVANVGDHERRLLSGQSIATAE